MESVAARWRVALPMMRGQNPLAGIEVMESVRFMSLAGGWQAAGSESPGGD